MQGRQFYDPEFSTFPAKCLKKLQGRFAGSKQVELIVHPGVVNLPEQELFLLGITKISRHRLHSQNQFILDIRA